MSQQVRILLVEDEFITLDNMRETLEEIGYEISGDAMTAEEAITILEEGKTDLAILDINIKGAHNGIWLGQQIQARFNIPFIFLTANSDRETVSAAAETRPAAYLVKPFSQADLFASIELALQTHADQPNQPTPTPQRLQASDSIFVKDEQAFRRIQLQDIHYVEAFKNYLEVHLAGERCVIRSTLKDFIAVLPKDTFIQTHRSFVVNVKKIDRVDGNALFIGNTMIPMSRSQRTEIMAKLRFFG